MSSFSGRVIKRSGPYEASIAQQPANPAIPPKSGRSPLQEIPIELQNQIWAYVGRFGLLKVNKTCHLFMERTADTKSLWFPNPKNLLPKPVQHNHSSLSYFHASRQQENLKTPTWREVYLVSDFEQRANWRINYADRATTLRDHTDQATTLRMQKYAIENLTRLSCFVQTHGVAYHHDLSKKLAISFLTLLYKWDILPSFFPHYNALVPRCIACRHLDFEENSITTFEDALESERIKYYSVRFQKREFIYQSLLSVINFTNHLEHVFDADEWRNISAKWLFIAGKFAYSSDEKGASLSVTAAKNAASMGSHLITEAQWDALQTVYLERAKSQLLDGKFFNFLVTMKAASSLSPQTGGTSRDLWRPAFLNSCFCGADYLLTFLTKNNVYQSHKDQMDYEISISMYSKVAKEIEYFVLIAYLIGKPPIRPDLQKKVEDLFSKHIKALKRKGSLAMAEIVERTARSLDADHLSESLRQLRQKHAVGVASVEQIFPP